MMGLVVVVIQSLSHVQLFKTPWAAGSQASLTTISPSLVKFMSMESVTPSNHLILRCPLLLPPSIFPSIRVFSTELALHTRWLKYWSFGFSTRLSNGYSELTSLGWTGLISTWYKRLSRVFAFIGRGRDRKPLSLSLSPCSSPPSLCEHTLRKGHVSTQ